MTLQQRIDAGLRRIVQLLKSHAGLLADLTTTNKTNLVAAINELRTWAVSRSNHTGTQTASTISDFNTSVDARISAQKAQNNGLATLGSDGKIPQGQLPAITIGESFPVASQSAMLALTAQIGDVAIRTDQSNRKYLLLGTDASVLSNWVDFTATGAVASVNGRTGSITLDKTDVGLGNVANVDTTNPANITQSASYRFVSDTEKSTWNSKYGSAEIGNPDTDFVAIVNDEYAL